MHLLAGYSLRVAYNFSERLHGIEFFVSTREKVSAAVKLLECSQFCNKQSIDEPYNLCGLLILQGKEQVRSWPTESRIYQVLGRWGIAS
jgi:hypothetical protein